MKRLYLKIYRFKPQKRVKNGREVICWCLHRKGTLRMLRELPKQAATYPNRQRHSEGRVNFLSQSSPKGGSRMIRILQKLIDQLRGRTGTLLFPGDVRRFQIGKIRKRAKLVIKK